MERSKTRETLLLLRERGERVGEKDQRGERQASRREKAEMDQPLREGFWQDTGESVVFIEAHRGNCTSLDV